MDTVANLNQRERAELFEQQLLPALSSDRYVRVERRCHDDCKLPAVKPLTHSPIRIKPQVACVESLQ